MCVCVCVCVSYAPGVCVCVCVCVSYAPGVGSSASRSLLGCLVKRPLNSTASPVSTLRCTGSRITFFFFSSSAGQTGSHWFKLVHTGLH